MNPYTPPTSDNGPDQAPAARRGKPCPQCASRNTAQETALRSRPSVLAVLLFGWLFLLIRGAFGKRAVVCHDCGAAWRYKTAGSWVALAVLAIVVGLIVLALFGER